MRKLLVMIAVLMMSACAFKETVDKDIGIPRHVAWIEFWNGGGLIAKYTDAKVVTRIDTNTKLVGKNISFYRYEITSQGKTEVIVDSEALSMKYATGLNDQE